MEELTSKNIGDPNVTKGSATMYCIGGLNFTPKSVSVTVGFEGDATVAWARLGAASSCPPPTQVSLLSPFEDDGVAPPETPSDLFVVLN